MTCVYHGTATGKNDLSLETFIITGAMSNKTIVPDGMVDQAPGFYVFFNADVAESFATDAVLKSHLHMPRKMIVEIDVDITSEEWDIDHEMAASYSMDLVWRMKAFIPLLNDKDLQRHHWNKEMLSAIAEHRDFKVQVDSWPVRLDKYDSNTVLYSSLVCSRPGAFLLQQLHELLEEKFPAEYRREKQGVLDALVERKGPPIKYIGSQPLRVSKIYIEPSWGTGLGEYSPVDKWEVAYDAAANRANADILRGVIPAKAGIPL